MKIKTKLLQLQRVAPKHTKFGQLYRETSATKKRYKRVNMWTLYVSDENEHMLRKHVFESKKKHRTPEEWHEWFGTHLDKIQLESILPALSVKTDLSKQWAVSRYIGWTGDAKYASRSTAIHSKRHKAKSSRSTHG